MKVCLRAESVRQEDNYVSVRTNCVEIRVYFLTDSIVRIRAGFDGDFAEESYSLVMTGWEDRMDGFLEGRRKRVQMAEAVLEDGEEKAVIRGKELRVEVEKEPFRICVYDIENTLLHADIVDLAYMEDSNHRRIHTSEITPQDCFYGFGEKSGEFNKAQKFMNMSPKDAMGYNPKETDSLYKHIPFYIKLNKKTKKAVGYFYHNTYECDFNMGREKSNYWKPHSTYRVDGGDIDLFLIAGPKMRDIVERYTDLTGKSAMLPRYALGYLGSSMYYPELEQDCDDAILEFIDTTKEEGIPVDGFQLSSGYCAIETEEGIKRCVFTWNKKRFKDPKDFFQQMTERGICVSPNVKPGILLLHPKKEEPKEEVEEEKTENVIDIEAKPEITFDDFEKLQFQVGEIIACEAVKKSKKLLCSQVKIGSQVRQIVSGIKAHYSAEEMVGKKVMVVTNLKPAKLAGILSEGMILCAEDADGNLSLMVPEKEMPAGAEIC